MGSRHTKTGALFASAAYAVECEVFASHFRWASIIGTTTALAAPSSNLLAEPECVPGEQRQDGDDECDRELCPSSGVHDAGR